MSRFQTDALRPSALPSASLGRPRPLTRAEPDAEGIPTGDAERDRAHAEWNTRIDREIKGVANGLKEIVELADIGPTPLPHANQLTALHLKLRTSQLIRAAQTLRDTAHELKLMLLLSDEVDTATRRDREMREVRRDARLGRARVARELGALLGGEGEGEGEDGDGSGERRGGGRGREEGDTRDGRDDRDGEERQDESIQGDEADETDEVAEGGAGEGEGHAGGEAQPDSMMETHRPDQDDQDDQADEDLVEVTEPPPNNQTGGDAVAHARSEHAAGGVAEEPQPQATQGDVDVEGDRSMELDEDDDLFEEVTA
ncbi:hypothetical protein JCM24511_00912 [Saitozyma sp. JCM 24511]|nr:hypothetical protein JCM24511_00912 [Saitozyma sp. JCM 24511]